MLAEAAMLAVLSVERGPGAEACADQPQLARSVERRLRRRVFVTVSEASLRLRVRFEQHGEELQARIELSNVDGTPRGTRTLVTTGHCSKLDDSLALSMALLVDEPPEPEAPTAARATAPKPRPTTRSIAIPAEVAAPREPWQFALGVAGKGVWGALPGVRPAAVLNLRLVPPVFPAILLQGEGFWPARAERNETSGARFQLLRMGLSVCPELVHGSHADVSLCLGQQVSWLAVEGYGFDHDAKQQRLGYAFVLGGEGRLRLLSPISLRGFLGAELPLLRDRFSSAGRGAQELFRPSPAGISAEIGLEVRLW
jgi:hypothetical protein